MSLLHISSKQSLLPRGNSIRRFHKRFALLKESATSKDYDFMKNEGNRIYTNPFKALNDTTYPQPPPPSYTLPGTNSAGPPVIPDPPNDFPYTGFDVKDPLKWPVDDRQFFSTQETGLPSPPAYKDVFFDKIDEAPIGDYPRNIPRLWHGLRDPTGHWDNGLRRDYGEVLPDDANFMGPMGPGVMVDWVPPFKGLLKIIAGIVGLTFACDYYDRNLSSNPVPKQYPFDGLRVQMGCDPNDPTDVHRAVS